MCSYSYNGWYKSYSYGNTDVFTSYDYVNGDIQYSYSYTKNNWSFEYAYSYDVMPPMGPTIVPNVVYPDLKPELISSTGTGWSSYNPVYMAKNYSY